MNLRALAGLLALDVRGNEAYDIQGVRDIERLSSDAVLEENGLYFIESPAVLKRHPRAVEQGAVLTTPALAEKFVHCLIAPEADIRLAFIKLLKLFDKTPTFAAGISPQAHIHASATIHPTAVIHAGVHVMEGAVVGPRCTLYPNVVVEPFAVIAEGCLLYPNVVIGHHCIIGRNAIIHGCAVIGADGFGFYDRQGQRYKIPQIGNVIIAEDVEIGASSTVDRATIESTRVGANTKLDDQVHVAHNCQVGRFVYIAGNTALGGSSIIGDGTMISGGVIIGDHLNVAPGSVIMAMSGLARDTEPKTAYFGIPARPAREMHRMNAALAKLPDLLVKLRAQDNAVKNTSETP